MNLSITAPIVRFGKTGFLRILGGDVFVLLLTERTGNEVLSEVHICTSGDTHSQSRRLPILPENPETTPSLESEIRSLLNVADGLLRDALSAKSEESAVQTEGAEYRIVLKTESEFGEAFALARGEYPLENVLTETGSEVLKRGVQGILKRRRKTA